MACLVGCLAHQGKVEQVLCVLQKVQHPQRDRGFVAQHAFSCITFLKAAI
jgi:hypothetical protein